EVDQLGFINNSTSVSLNGRIDLLADYNAIPNSNITTGAPAFLLTSTGTVTLGLGSVTQIVPEISSTDRVIGTDLALHSSILIEGLAIHGEAGSILFPPSPAIPPHPTNPTI